MKKETSIRLFIGILIFLFFVIALLYRVALPYDKVFTSEGIKFTSNDAYFHMRIVDSMIHNFPHATQFDPYLIYPNEAGGLAPTFMDWLLALIILAVGLGSPTPHLIDVIGVYFPAIIAALTVIPVFFIGKALFNRWAGVLAAAMVAVLPGEFLGRSILGFTDNHIVETFFSTVAILFVILAIKSASEKQLMLSHFVKRDWKTIIKPTIYSLLAGLFLAVYILSWQGALIFVFILAVYFIVQFIIDHLKQKSTEYLGITGFLMFLVCFIIFQPFSPTQDFSASIVIAMLLPPVLMAISLLTSRLKLKPAYYPLVLAVLGGAFVGIFYASNQFVLKLMLDKFALVFNPSGATATTTLEMQRFLFPQGNFSTVIAWGNFTTSFFLFPGVPIPGIAIISLVYMVYVFVRKKGEENSWLLLFVWTLIITVATLSQRRFAYYLAINIALLSAYLFWQILWWAGLRKLTPNTEDTGVSPAVTTKEKKKQKQAKKSGLSIYSLNVLLALIAAFFLIIFPNILKSKGVAAQALFAPSDAWQSSLIWMRDNTPEPMGDPDAYYRLYARPKPGKSFNYPASVYGVTAWWDYGYWITRIARRIPNTNPSQDPEPIKKVSSFLLSTDESSARELLKELGSSYIILDYEICTNKFWAVVTWADKPQEQYFDIYYAPYQGQLKPVQVFKPAFYQTILARLYCFDGKAVTQIKPVVLVYDEKTDRSGNKYKQVTNIKEFTDYQEAKRYIASQTSGKYDIIGITPFDSPIPLEPLSGFDLVHSSPNTQPITDNRTIPEIKIFQYTAK